MKSAKIARIDAITLSHKTLQGKCAAHILHWLLCLVDLQSIPNIYHHISCLLFTQRHWYPIATTKIGTHPNRPGVFSVSFFCLSINQPEHLRIVISSRNYMVFDDYFLLRLFIFHKWLNDFILDGEMFFMICFFFFANNYSSSSVDLFQNFIKKSEKRDRKLYVCVLLMCKKKPA